MHSHRSNYLHALQACQLTLLLSGEHPISQAVGQQFAQGLIDALVMQGVMYSHKSNYLPAFLAFGQCPT